MNFIRRIFGLHKLVKERERLTETQNTLKRANGNMDKIVATLNGEEGWFLQLENANVSSNNNSVCSNNND